MKALHKKSFTLIELLIVITIIGILAVALVPRISQGPARARDVARKADLQNIAAALELYYADYGEYPNDTGTLPETDCVGEGNWLDSALGNYLDSIPTDDSTDFNACPTGYYYKVMPYSASGSSPNAYAIIAKLETVPQKTGDGAFCNNTNLSTTAGSNLEGFINLYLDMPCPADNGYYSTYH